MTYYLIGDIGTQWFFYIVSKNEDKIVDVLDLRGLTNIESTLLSNIYGREMMEKILVFNDHRLNNGGGSFYGWSMSELEFGRIKRMLELYPAIQEFNKIKDSV